MEDGTELPEGLQPTPITPPIERGPVPELPTDPSIFQRYGAYRSDALFTLNDLVSGASSTSAAITLSGAPAGASFVGFWSAQQLTNILPTGRLPGETNIISAFTETRLMLGAVNGYEYISNGAYQDTIVNGDWNLS